MRPGSRDRAHAFMSSQTDSKNVWPSQHFNDGERRTMLPQSSLETASAVSAVSSSADLDALNLTKMGYNQSMERKFSIWSLLGVGFSLTNSWFGISAALVTGINSGGPLLLMYGIPIVVAINSCTGICLGELASAMPNAGGQYYWASQLASPRWARFSSYLTGWFAWTGSIFTSASVALALASAVVGCWQLGHPDFVIHQWHVFVAYQVINAFCFFFNCWGRALPKIATVTLYLSLCSFVIILVTVPVKASSHQTAKFVFATFVNNTGWSSNGIAFIVGLVNANWAFSCLDCATHLAEEVPRPEKTIPMAVMGTLAIGFTTAWFFCMAMFFSIVGDFQELVETPTLVPILELFHHALGSRAGAIALESLIISTGLGCMIASHTWQSRLCWSFCRDGGLPLHRALSEVVPAMYVPLKAHVFSCIVVAVVGCLYLVSMTAFNSMATACITLLYISYSIPVLALLVRGRDKLAHGPFWFPTLGLVANVVLLVWTVFTLVMYSLPYTMPVTTGNMNYVSVVYVLITGIVVVDWQFRGKRDYRGVGELENDSPADEDEVEVQRQSTKTGLP